MSFFKGDVRIFSIKVDEDYIPVGCLISNDIEESVEMLNTTTRASNGWRTSVPTTQEYNIPFEGIQVLTDSSVLSYDYLKTLKRARTRIEWQISDNSSLRDQGEGYITDLREGNSVGEFLSFSGNVRGYGVPIVITLEGDLFQDGSVMLFQDGNEILFN
ncbi:hypothetical protein [Flagellimonas sp. SN16]|uniref:hypothetical protein n=1 Tax=Flagellimonas sp. SN16 TaxID=3415142 RepID=UPI003C6068C1